MDIFFLKKKPDEKRDKKLEIQKSRVKYLAKNMMMKNKKCQHQTEYICSTLKNVFFFQFLGSKKGDRDQYVYKLSSHQKILKRWPKDWFLASIHNGGSICVCVCVWTKEKEKSTTKIGQKEKFEMDFQINV